MHMNKENTVGKILKVIGVIVVVAGSILGLITGSRAGRFGLIPALYLIGTTFVSGMLFIGFPEIIKLLHEINLKINGSEKKNGEEAFQIASEKGQKDNEIIWEMDPRDKAQIEQLFKENNQAVLEIVQTPSKFIYAVKTEDAIKIVEAGGFKATILNDDEYPKIKEWVVNNIR